MNESTYRRFELPIVFASLLALASACASDGDPADNTGRGGNSNNSGSGGSVAASGGSGGSGTGGSAPATGGGTTTGGTGGSEPGTGGSSTAGTGGASAPSICDTKLKARPAYVGNLEDSEFVDGTPPGGWFGYIQDKERLDALTVAKPGAVETTQGIRFSGGEADYAGVGYGFECGDVSKYEGISFWAKGATAAKIKFLAVIPATDPKPPLGKGDCEHTEELPCYDHPAKTVTLTTEWKQYVVKFDELEQSGSGAIAKFNGVMNGLQFVNAGKVDSFDFSIDEVSFFTGTPPEGAIEEP